MDLELYDDQKRLSPEHTKLVKELVEFAAKTLEKAPDTEMSITIVDDAEINRINKEYRDTDRVTDV
ncbi:MAG: rRNA maturation RNase YbeY, partial [Lactobacillus sp.]|nr:rRNA maturation RNase YbeY [Lactobacillus sp.]